MSIFVDILMVLVYDSSWYFCRCLWPLHAHCFQRKQPEETSLYEETILSFKSEFSGQHNG